MTVTSRHWDIAPPAMAGTYPAGRPWLPAGLTDSGEEGRVGARTGWRGAHRDPAAGVCAAAGRQRVRRARVRGAGGAGADGGAGGCVGAGGRAASGGAGAVAGEALADVPSQLLRQREAPPLE